MAIHFAWPVKTNTKEFPKQELEAAVGAARGSSTYMQATVPAFAGVAAVSLLAVGWRRRKAYRKRGKLVSGVYHMVSTMGMP